MVNWTASSLKDLQHIYDHIAENSRYYAKKVIISIITHADKLTRFPQMGRMVPEIMNPSIREIFMYSYRIIYEIKDNEVNILAVVHGKRNPDDLMNI